MNLPWQYICQKGKTRFYRGLILIITDVGTECHSISGLFVCLFKLCASVISITESPCCSLFHQQAPGGKIIDFGPVTWSSYVGPK